MKIILFHSWVKRSLFTGTAFVLLSTVLLHGEIISANRRIQWNPGIPGGIPERATIFKTLTGIDNTGATDVRAAIQSALDTCPANQVVKLPAGKFRVVGGLVMPSYVTLRGEGTSTVISSHGSAASLFEFGTSGLQWDPNPISTGVSGGATAGSTAITVASTTGITVGTYLVITELNDPAYVSIDGTINSPATWVDSWSTSGQRARGQIVEVTSVSGNTIDITPGLYSAYSRTPWATRFAAGCKWSGVENLKTYANNTGTSRNFFFQRAAYCWVQGVESDYTDGDHCTLDWSYRCEVRRNYFHNAYIHTSGNFDNMIGLRTKTTACLVIDNITRRLHCGIMVEWGAAGNVIAYNYDEGNFDQGSASGNRWLPPSIIGNHGAHPQFNLFEGNVGQKFQSDSYWGSASHQTIFRNYFSGTGVAHPPYTGRGVEDTNTTVSLIQANRAIDIWEIHPVHNVVGNVVGSQPLLARNVVRKAVNPEARAYDNPPYLFTYGYTSESAGGGPALANPTLTLLEHGNYDIKTAGIVWDPAISDRNIPDSLFLSSKPAWFGSLAFPPVNPASPSFSPMMIPAGYRWINKRDPAAGTINLSPIAKASANITSGTAPLSVAFSSAGSSDPEQASLTYKWTFGDGGNSTAANPSYTYQTPGEYLANLTVSDGTNSIQALALTVAVSGVIIPGTGLQAAYSFEETVGTVVADSSGKSLSGTFTNAVRSPGKNGQGLYFNGTNSLVFIDHTAALAATTGLTIEAWVNPATPSTTWRPIVFKPYDATRVSYVLQGSSAPSGVPSLGISVSPSNLSGTSNLPVNAWSHLAATYDGTNMRLYVNGVLVGSREQTGPIITSNEPLTIGGSALFDAYWHGTIDDVRIYTRALGLSEIQNDMKIAVPAIKAPAAPTGLRTVQP